MKFSRGLPLLLSPSIFPVTTIILKSMLSHDMSQETHLSRSDSVHQFPLCSSSPQYLIICDMVLNSKKLICVAFFCETTFSVASNFLSMFGDIVQITCHIGAFCFDACQFGAFHFGDFHFDAILVRRVSLWRASTSARFSLARFPILYLS